MNRRPNRSIHRLSRNAILLVAFLFALALAKILLGSPPADSEPALVPPTAAPKTPQGPPVETAELKTIEQLSDRVVEYHISVRLDAETKQLHGKQNVYWTNPGKKPVQELYFHLYPNAFQSKKSTFLKESGGKLRQDKMKSDSYGNMRITALSMDDGYPLLRKMQYVQPDDGNSHDETLVRVKLPRFVQPGEKVVVRMEFSVQLPQVFARMGYADDFVMAGQWFPKLSVYETKGMRGRDEEGWNLHQYHGSSEFYANFGIYSVQIEVPAKYTVAATGFPTKSAVVSGETKTYHFYADDVHDFAWAASPNFVYAEEPFSTKHVPGVKIKLYLDPAHEHLKDRYFHVAKQSLASFSEWYGSYPYSTLSIIVPPKGGNGAGGMEYPTLVTAWEAAEEDPDLELERVVAHEIGHQYFYGMVATNEFEEAWLDEGFTSYAEEKFMETEFDVRPITPIESSYITTPAPLRLDAWNYNGHDHYADNVYTRAKLVLLDIERTIGPEKMKKVMKMYFTRWKFKHPSTADFQKTLESVTKRSWKSYFDRYVYGGDMVDYSVDRIDAKRIERDGAVLYESTVRVVRHSGAAARVLIRIHFSDGRYVDKIVNGSKDRASLIITHTAPVDWALLDPDYTLALENKHMNNFLASNIDNAWSTRWKLGTIKMIEAMFAWIAW